jgi:alginate O-acetyltransferase complex protein AlgJ
VRTEAGGPLPPDRSSPILVLGDSHVLVFHAGGDMHATGAGFVDLLAYRLRMPLDLIGVRGSGATPARVNLFRRSRSNSDYLAPKKLIIWCFSAREFTESDGWRKLPVAP